MDKIQTPKGKIFEMLIKKRKPYEKNKNFEIFTGIDPVNCTKVSHIGRILK